MRRVNRRLAHQGEQIRRVRPGMRRDRMFAFANYYTLNTNRNLIVDGFSDLEGTARDLGVLRDGNNSTQERREAARSAARLER